MANGVKSLDNLNCSASGMFVFNNIPSFMELLRNYINGFME